MNHVLAITIGKEGVREILNVRPLGSKMNIVVYSLPPCALTTGKRPHAGACC